MVMLLKLRMLNVYPTNVIFLAIHCLLAQCSKQLHPLCRTTFAANLGIFTVKDDCHALERMTLRLRVEEVNDAGSHGEPDDVA